MRLISDETLAIITIYQEASGEPWEGKVAVAEVIRNRMARKYASDGTVAGTVLAPYQFSGWNADAGKTRIKNMRLDGDDTIVAQCRAAWSEAYNRNSNLTNGAVLYLNPVTVLKQAGKLPGWAADPRNATKVNDAQVVARIGRHVFLKGI